MSSFLKYREENAIHTPITADIISGDVSLQNKRIIFKSGKNWLKSFVIMIGQILLGIVGFLVINFSEQFAFGAGCIPVMNYKWFW